MLTAFSGNAPDNAHEGDHIDRNTRSDIPPNLQWLHYRLNLQREDQFKSARQKAGNRFNQQDEPWTRPGERWEKDPKTGREVSSEGRVRSLYHSKQTPTSWTPKRGLCGYHYVGHDRVHIMVCRAFHGDPPGPEFTEVNHMDLNKSNNTPQNLEWMTPKQNVQHARRGNKNRGDGGHTKRKMVELRCKGETGWGDWITFESQQAATAAYGLNRGILSFRMLRKGLSSRVPSSGKTYEARHFDDPKQRDLPGEEWRSVAVEKSHRLLRL